MLFFFKYSSIFLLPIVHTYSQRADLGVCDLTITHERRSAVDFTMPFMNLGKLRALNLPVEMLINLT